MRRESGRSGGKRKAKWKKEKEGKGLS